MFNKLGNNVNYTEKLNFLQIVNFHDTHLVLKGFKFQYIKEKNDYTSI